MLHGGGMNLSDRAAHLPKSITASRALLRIGTEPDRPVKTDGADAVIFG